MNENILQKMIELRNQGMTFQAIADKLNADSIPTFSGKGKWDKRTIQRKLEQSEKELTVKQLQKECENMSLQLQTYQSEIAERDSVIYGLNKTIEILKEQLAKSLPKNPNNFEGWSVTKNPDGFYRMFRKFSGKTIGIHIGREFDPEKARRKIAEMNERIKPGVILLPKKRGRKSQIRTQEKPLSLCAIPFEIRLRSVCPDNRTYRIDKVRALFPDMNHQAFNQALTEVAESKKIELLSGDPRECNPDDLLSVNNILYVNFEWR